MEFVLKTVVICGSRRYKKEIIKFGADLKKLGVLVFEPYINSNYDGWGELSGEFQKYIVLGLELDHFYKIEMADVVFVYNKDGYSGVSVTLEIGCAVAKGKPVYALEQDTTEICRNVLFRDITPTPGELIKKL